MAKKKKQKDDHHIIANNRKAYHNYYILDEWEAGIALLGSEVKSLRQGKATIAEGYVLAEGNEVYLVNSYIAEYKQAGDRNHHPNRKRKLLLRRSEINKLIGRLKNTGLTAVPLVLYFNLKGIAKLRIGLAQGKSKYDKREVKKKRDWAREKGRLLKEK